MTLTPDQLVDLVIRAIATLGFPIAVACWLLWRDYTQTKPMIELLTRISTILELFVHYDDATDTYRLTDATKDTLYRTLPRG